MNDSIAEHMTIRVEGVDRAGTRFMLSFREPADQRFDADTVAAWSAWHQWVGSRLEQPANPVRWAITVGGDNQDNREAFVSGVAIVVADELDQARAYAEVSPAVRRGGSVEVGRLVDLWPSRCLGDKNMRTSGSATFERRFEGVVARSHGLDRLPVPVGKAGDQFSRQAHRVGQETRCPGSPIPTVPARPEQWCRQIELYQKYFVNGAPYLRSRAPGGGNSAQSN